MVGTNKRSILRPLWSLIALGLLMSIIFMQPIAKAEDSSQFGIRPAKVGTATTSKGYFVLNGQPGETLIDSIVVANPGNIPVKLQLYPADATTGMQSGIDYSTQSDPQKNVATWITLDTTKLEILPKTQSSISFKILIPKNALPGQHLGAISAQLDNTSISPKNSTNSSDANMTVKTVTRALTAVQINVGGAADIASLKINGAEVTEVASQTALTLSLQNNGTGLIKPKGEVSLADSTGKTVMTSKLALDTFLPQDSIAYPVPGKLPEPGTYKVHASLDFGGSAPALYDGQVEVKAPAVKAAVAAPAPATQASANSANQPAAANASGQGQAATNTSGQVAAKANAATTGAAASMKLPFVGTTNSNSTPVAVASSDSSSMLVGILMGIAAMLALSTLGLGGYVLRHRTKKGK